MSLVSYACSDQSLVLGQEHGLRVFKKRTLRRMFILKGEEIAGT
jgi:hypothetical protein